MQEYILAIFSIRTSTMQFNNVLQKNGIRSVVVETPKSASASCGISVRFDTKYFEQAKQILKYSVIKNFVRFYHFTENLDWLKIESDFPWMSEKKLDYSEIS